ncbi:MAG: putative membrane protein YgcG [Saprospiraceae bacterium]
MSITNYQLPTKEKMAVEVFELEYNSSRENLTIPEYGRNVQNLINYAKEMEDDDERQLFVEKIVRLMLQLNPHSKNLDDVREKIWLHVFRIADYDLNVTPPKGVSVTPEAKRKKPEIVPYPPNQMRFRHYGGNVHAMIKRAREMEEGYIKDSFVEVIGSYMKMAYRTWNTEHFVSDNVIIDDLESLSDGELELTDSAEINGLAQANRRRRRPENNNNDRRSNGRGGRSNGRGGRSNGRGGGRSNTGGGRGRR